ncbi:DUF998 domain-containing protein [Sediminibacterium roseum]|uniref:DUF998 domain-containing protein n=1 Tax=Sediminibacterium roseum TaxID=1978412 RepID=A0ABX0A0E8_9BACT|nr:DUF998 domain-containing protein [Sediminibacterium roseum]NCI52057.1 DUF998 domain-containing protein [Sediminibacterium roseum]
MKNKLLVSCGILAPLLYIAMNVFIPGRFPGYSTVTQTISEISAWNAPTRTLWLWWAGGYVLLTAAFGIGIIRSASGNWILYIAGYFVLIYAAFNIYWPPMHLRGAGTSFSDKLHITWAIITILLMMLIMVFTMAALGRSFRIYTLITFLVFIVFGTLTFIEAPGIPQNLPTPRIGIWERINVGAFMLWTIVFSVSLLKKQAALSTAGEKS